MQPLLYISLFLVALAIIGSILFMRYRSTPEGAWKKRVMDHFSELNARLSRAQSKIDHTQRDKDQACDRIRATYRERFMQSISVTTLDDYPNVGPAMVEALRQAGYRSLSDFHLLKTLTTGKIPGIGAAKWGYIQSAVSQLQADSEDQFRRGAFPEVDEMNAKLQAADREMEERALAASAEAAAVRLACDQMADQVAMARKVTFIGSVLGQKVPELTADFMNIPLPRVGAIVIPTLPTPEPPASPTSAPAAPKKQPKPKSGDPFADHVPDIAPRQAPTPTVTKTEPAAIPAPSPSDPFDETGCRAILEIDPQWDLSADLVRRQYHRLSDQNDPDKLKGMAADLIAFTRQKREKIRKAAETLMAKFGEPLEKPAPVTNADPRHNPDLDSVFG
jgi:hypothetical protein